MALHWLVIWWVVSLSFPLGLPCVCHTCGTKSHTTKYFTHFGETPSPVIDRLKTETELLAILHSTTFYHHRCFRLRRDFQAWGMQTGSVGGDKMIMSKKSYVKLSFKVTHFYIFNIWQYVQLIWSIFFTCSRLDWRYNASVLRSSCRNKNFPDRYKAFSISQFVHPRFLSSSPHPVQA